MPSVIHLKFGREGSLPPGTVIVDLPKAGAEAVGLHLNHNGVSDEDVQLLQAHLALLRRVGWVQQLYARYVGEAEGKRLFRNDAR
jgi:hypothetical protein